MDAWSALRILLLSIVDALVPALFATLVVLTSVEYWTDPSRPLVTSLSVGLVVFLVTVGFGLASAVLRDRPFPVTRAVKRFLDWWPFPAFP